MKKFSTLYFLLGITTAAYQPYSVMFLNEFGISPNAIGIIVAFSAIVKIFANPFWGYVTDRIGSVKKVFLICLTSSAILIQLFIFLSSEYIVSILYLIVALFVYSTIPLMDNWTIQGIKDKDSNGYGFIRIWPCIAFAVSAFLLGKLIQITSINSIFPVYGVFALITAAFALLVKNNNIPKGNKINIKSIKNIFSDRRYILFLIFCFIFYIPITGVYTFFPLLMDSLGSTKSQFGFSIFIMSICEVPLYLFGKYLLKKIKPINIIFIATIFFCCTILMYSLAKNPLHIIFIQPLRGFAQALFMLGFLYYLDQIAPIELKATYMTVAVSVNTGLSGIIGNLLGGHLIKVMGIYKMFYICTIICFIVSGLFMLFIIKKKS